MSRKGLFIIFLLISILLNIFISKVCFAQNEVTAKTVDTYHDIPQNTPLLAISRTNLDTGSSKPGDVFTAKVVEDLKICNKIIIPANSIVCGMVTEVRKPKRYPLRNGLITLYINQIETPQGQKISLEGREVSGKIISPLEQTIRRRVVGTLPPRAASYGATIPVGRATDLSGGVVYAIGMGAAVTAGAISGFAVPDPCRSRIRSSFERAVDSTPIGAVRGFVAMGQEVGIKSGDGIMLNFDKKTIAKIQSELVAQFINQNQGVASK